MALKSVISIKSYVSPLEITESCFTYKHIETDRIYISICVCRCVLVRSQVITITHNWSRVFWLGLLAIVGRETYQSYSSFCSGCSPSGWAQIPRSAEGPADSAHTSLECGVLAFSVCVCVWC